MKLITLLMLVLSIGCARLQGPQGAPGQAGDPGLQGTPGQTGAEGPQGQPGASESTVQFCPGYAPTSFPEYGICINNQLYAVYWDAGAPNAWLALIPPGTYLSTSTNAACTFTVLPNCQLQ